MVGTFGIITGHWTDSYGWTQPEMASALSIFLLATTLAVPAVGIAVDRFGTRRTAIAGVITFAGMLTFAGFGIQSLRSLFVFYALLGIVGAFTNPITYIAAISAWFDQRRGFALGLAVAGQGLGGALLPLFAEATSENLGWQWAFFGMAALLLLLVLPLIWRFVWDDPARFGEVPDGKAFSAGSPPVKVQASGITLEQAIRTRTFWIIMITFALFGLTAYALAGHLVALIRERHIATLPQAAVMGSVSGIAAIFGRLAFGWLLDRFPVPIVGAGGVLLGVMAQFLLLNLDHFGPMALMMAMLFGASMGAETDLLSLLVGRYFGTVALSRIYSWQNVSFLVGAAIGPPFFALLLVSFDGLTVPILILAAISIASALLMLSLHFSPQLGSMPAGTEPPAPETPDAARRPGNAASSVKDQAA